MYRRQYHPYQGYQRNNSTFIDHRTLKNCGIPPSKFSHEVQYAFKHNIHHNQKVNVCEDATFTLNVNTRQESVTPLLKHTITNYDPQYTVSTVYQYDQVKGLINKVIHFKNKIGEEENLKMFDVFKRVIETYSYTLLNRCSLKLLNLNYTFDNIFGQTITNGTKYADLCCAPGGFTFFLLNSFPKCQMEVYMTSMAHVDNLDTFLKIDFNTIHNVNCRSTIGIFEGDLKEAEFRLST